MPSLAEVRPRYGEASLIDVMPGVLAALGVPMLDVPVLGVPARDPLGLADRLSGIRKIAVLLVDGLGFHLISTAAEVAPTLADIHAGRLGHMLRLTSGFPSTTPVSLVGLCTGAVPGEHGVVGFSVRVPDTTRVLSHIRWADDPDPATWQPVPTVFQRTTRAGVASSVVSRPEFEGSGLTVAAYRGAAYRPALDIDSLAAAMTTALAGADGPALVYGYHPDLDHAGHVWGVDSDEWREEARCVDRLVTPLAARLPRDAALLITADHGMFDVPLDRRFDIDGDTRLRAGVSVMAGEPRVRYLHVEPGAIEDVLATWRGVLGGGACVATREEAVAAGWFGDVAPAHLARIGDVVVACRDRHVVVASTAQPFEAKLVGYHGSFTAAEMEIPLIIIRGDE